MRAESPKILLVGREFTPGSTFLERLCRNGCACAVAGSLEEARAVVRESEFDLVLSGIALADGSAVPLLGLLEGTPATLFFCVAVHDGCWWLPALDRGRRTWGQAALRPAQFAAILAELLGTDALRSDASASAPNVIPMPPPVITPPKPERITAGQPKSRKSSA